MGYCSKKLSLCLIVEMMKQLLEATGRQPIDQNQKLIKLTRTPELGRL